MNIRPRSLVAITAGMGKELTQERVELPIERHGCVSGWSEV